jgi:hypothetical protein
LTRVTIRRLCGSGNLILRDYPWPERCRLSGNSSYADVALLAFGKLDVAARTGRSYRVAEHVCRTPTSGCNLQAFAADHDRKSFS